MKQTTNKWTILLVSVLYLITEQEFTSLTSIFEEVKKLIFEI